MSELEDVFTVRIGDDSVFGASTFNAEFIDTIGVRGRAINESGWYL